MSTMVRISAAIRDETIRNIISHKFAKERLELETLQEKADLAQKEAEKLAYDTAFTKEQRDVLSKYNAAFFFPRKHHVLIRIEHGPGNYVDHTAVFGEDLPVPFKFYISGGVAAVIDKDHPYAKAVEAETAADRERDVFRTQLNEKEYALKRKVLTVMESVTTVKRLQEVWPEIIDFLPETVSGSGGQLPAHIIADLNKEIGI